MKTEYDILSFGGGVQSTAILMMMVDGSLPKVDAAIFADPGEESDATYAHIDWCEARFAEMGIPFYRRSAGGRLGDHLKVGRNSTGGQFASVPFYTVSPSGDKGLIRRQCTKEYKTQIVERAVRRDVLGLKPRQRVPVNVTIRQWIGISYDEQARAVRIAKRFAESVKWSTAYFPLLDRRIERRHCVELLKSLVPHTVPRSACVFCPYKGQAEWRRLRDEDPKGWARAVEVDNALRIPGNVVNRRIKGVMYVHRSCVPLRDADLRDKDDAQGQSLFRFNTFDAECEGMCGH